MSQGFQPIGSNISKAELHKGLGDGTLVKGKRFRQGRIETMCDCCTEFEDILRSVESERGRVYNICDSCMAPP